MEKKIIIVVEAEALIAKDIKNSLVKSGYSVPSVVATGEKAVAESEKYCPNLVLMDIKLKGEMNGIDAAKIIKEKFDIPVVFLTAYADDSILQEAKASEPYGYIVKPFQDKELKAIIEMAINKHEKVVELKKERDLFQSLASKKVVHEHIFIRSNYKLNKINFSDIYYIEAKKDYIIIHTAETSYLTHCTMKEIMKHLPEKEFVRVHRSHIVRVDKIHTVKFPEIILDGKVKVIPMGTLYRTEMKKKLNVLHY